MTQNSNMIMQRLHAPAKVNLTLEIAGRDENGYHMLDSLMGFTEFGDSLTLSYQHQEATKADQPILHIDGDFGAQLTKQGPADQNLILRAIDVMRKNQLAHSEWPKSLSITLSKNIPIAAGLGGGSMDAAIVMRALRAQPSDSNAEAPSPLHFEALPHIIRDEIIQRLGAEMPVCLQAPGLFHIQGLGDIVTPVQQNTLRKVAIVLFNARDALSTKEVFQRYREMIESGAIRFSTPSHHNHAFAQDYSTMSFEARLQTIQNSRNDLQPAAFSIMPALQGYFDDISSTYSPYLTRMSGSGATLYALYADIDTAEHAAQELRQKHPECWITTTQILI